MLSTILAIILVVWLLGTLGSVGGSLIHVLLLVAFAVAIMELVTTYTAITSGKERSSKNWWPQIDRVATPDELP